MKLNIKKENIVLVSLSLLFLFIPSIILTIALYIFLGHFIGCFLLSLASIFIIGQISNIFVQKKTEMDIIRFKNQLAEIVSQQSVEVSCAYCKARCNVPIRLNIRNTFECKDCKQTNLIIFQFATAQVTTPLENPQLGTIPLTKVINEQNNPTITKN